MKYFNYDVRKKSYMIEFYNDDGIEPEEAILFSLPPQSESFSHPQRINKTPTFGGAVVDDFGNDLIDIRLSGTTVNEELRLIDYKNTKNTPVTGSKEIEKIEAIIHKYGEIEKLKNKKVLLYSLDNTKLNNCWYIIIENFDVKRSSQNPKAYLFDLKCSGYYPKDKNKNKSYSVNNPEYTESYDYREQITDVQNITITLTERLTGIQKLLKVIQMGSRKYAQGIEYINKAQNLILDFNSKVDTVVNSITEYADVTIGYITETKHLGDILIESAVRNTFGVALNLYESACSVHNAIMDFAVWGRDLVEDSISGDLFNSIVAYYKREFNADYQEAKYNWLTLIGNIEDQSTDLKLNTIKITHDASVITTPGDRDHNDRLVKVTNLSYKLLKENDTLDSLAYTHLGSTEYSSLIGMLNPDFENLKVGDEIKIPQLGSINKVLNFGEDNYGKDIYIKNGDFEFRNGDLKTTQGIKTLNQAIDNRLSTARDSRIRFALYGINAQIGQPHLSESYLMSSIEETLLQDPRIKSIDSIKFNGRGDTLNITINYTDINGSKNNYGGTI